MKILIPILLALFISSYASANEYSDNPSYIIRYGEVLVSKVMENGYTIMIMKYKDSSGFTTAWRCVVGTDADSSCREIK